VGRHGDSTEKGNGRRDGGTARVLPFPDLIGARRKAACAVIRDEFDRLPDTRTEKVRNVQQRIRESYYDRPDVVEEILRRLLMGLCEG